MGIPSRFNSSGEERPAASVAKLVIFSLAVGTGTLGARGVGGVLV